MKMNVLRQGRGKPLLLVHGLGGQASSWQTVIGPLAAEREVLAVDLPGFGATPALASAVSIRTLADALTELLAAEGRLGIDAVGSSMGARLVLELARRGGVLGAVVSLDPGGFWRGWERSVFHRSIWLSIGLLSLLRPWLKPLAANSAGRTALLLQFSARPWALPTRAVQDELLSYVDSPSFDELLDQLAYGVVQQFAPRGSITQPLVIGWGRRDRVCFPQQAERALHAFPDARLHWFDNCGHFPQWDRPEETVRLILETTSG